MWWTPKYKDWTLKHCKHYLRWNFIDRVTCQIQSGTKVGRRFLGTMQKRTELSRIVKNIEMIFRKTNVERTEIPWKESWIRNAFLSHGTRSKLHFKSGMCRGVRSGLWCTGPPPSKGGACAPKPTSYAPAHSWFNFLFKEFPFVPRSFFWKSFLYF